MAGGKPLAHLLNLVQAAPSAWSSNLLAVDSRDFLEQLVVADLSLTGTGLVDHQGVFPVCGRTQTFR